MRAGLFRKFGPKSRRPKWAEELADPTTAKLLGIQENDIWIAAQALQFSFVLVTNDKMLPVRQVAPELRIENWARSGAKSG